MNILITGGHSGMGLELTKRLLNEGHKLGLVVRNEKRKDEAIAQIGNSELIDFFYADLSIQKEVVKVASEVKEKWTKLDGIFNNAGVLLDKAYYSGQGNEMHFEVNALAPYILINELKPLLEKSEKPFVINTATGGMESKKSIDIDELKQPKKFVKLLGSYMQSKFAMTLLLNNFAKVNENIRVAHLNPGAIKTKMTSGSGMPALLKPIRNLLFSSPEKGANRIYNVAFDAKYAEQTGFFVNEGGKIKSFKKALTKSELNQLEGCITIH